MQLARNLIVVVAVTGVVLPMTARECLSGLGFNIGLWGPCGGCGFGLDFCLCSPCNWCFQPPAHCGCGAPPMYAPPPTLVPQATCLPQQFVTYRDVPQTQIRREAYVENVPVTALQPVTRTVMVPQQVTEMVPQTVYQPQMRYRDVAYQTVQRVAETHTMLVPQPTVAFAQPVSSYAPSCAAPGVPSYGLLPTATPLSVTPAYSSPSIPTMPSITVSPYGTNPVPQYPDVTANPTSSRRSSMFRPAPSAARVQQSPRF